MSFVTTQPQALTYAAGKLHTLGSAMATESAAVAHPTTGVIPAAADEVSALQATIFAAYGTLYQSVNAQAAAIHELFVHTLGASAASYVATESTNSATTASAFSAQISGFLSSAANSAGFLPAVPGSNVANVVNIGGGNWGSATSDLLSLVEGNILPAENEDVAADAVGSAAGPAGDGAVLTGAVGPVGVPPALGQTASSSGQAVPPSWAGEAAVAAGPEAATSAAWSMPEPQSTAVTAVPAGIPVAATAGKTAGLGAPRYGAKPTVMGRPAGV